MFIQCQNCQTTFKIDEHQIPPTKSVVRCTKCSEPIPLNRETQDQLLKQSPTKIVECDSCGTQYSVPLHSIKKESTSARCGKCGHLFTVSKSSEQPGSSADAYADDIDTDDIDLDNIDIPTESEIEVDDLFDDMSESRGKKRASKTKDTTEAYLESVKLTKDGEEAAADDPDLGINEISADKKYRIFLRPKKGEAESEAPPAKRKADKKAKKQKPPKRSKKDTKADAKAPSRRKHIILWLIWGLIIVVLVALAWLVMDVKTGEIYTQPQTETFDNQSKIAILEPLNGRLVDNPQIEGKMFVLNGKLLNIYGPEVALSKIEIEGFLYTRTSEQPLTGISYAGVVLDEDQLQSMNKIEIQSALMSQSQATDNLLEFGSDDLIDFQVVFFNAPDPQQINKLGARIKKFNRRKR